MSTVTRTIGELLEDRHNAILVPGRSPRVMANKVVEVRARRDLQWHISDMSRREAYELFGLTKFLEGHRGVYGVKE